MNFHRILACALFAGAVGFANSGGPTAGLSGAPGEDDCSQCHGGASGAGKLTIALSAGGTTYVAGQTIKVKVTLEDPTALRWGFQLTARQTASTGAAAGKLATADANTQVETVGGVDFISQTAAGTFRTTRNSATWEFNWTAPAAGTGSVTFYSAGNAANNNGATSGDRIYKGSLVLTEGTTSGGGTPTASTHVIPMIGGGSGWSSALYFVNNTDAEVSFDARFRKNDGTAMDVTPDGGTAGSTQKVTIPGRGLGFMTLPDSGSLAQGSLGVDLPDGVTGFAALRLSAQNMPDQELQIPIARTADLTRTVVVFDDTKSDTQLAVANPGGAEASITLTVRDEKGATVGSAASFRLAAGAKAVFLIKDRVADAAGKRGTIELTGGVSAVNIRFGGSALVATEAISELEQ
jgi:hypothetical protein